MRNSDRFTERARKPSIWPRRPRRAGPQLRGHGAPAAGHRPGGRGPGSQGPPGQRHRRRSGGGAGRALRGPGTPGTLPRPDAPGQAGHGWPWPTPAGWVTITWARSTCSWASCGSPAPLRPGSSPPWGWTSTALYRHHGRVRQSRERPRPPGRCPHCPPGRRQHQTLDQYSRDLTEIAEKGGLDPVIGRDVEEIARVIQSCPAAPRTTPSSSASRRGQDRRGGGAGTEGGRRRRAGGPVQ
jgi:hypothetical protein